MPTIDRTTFVILPSYVESACSVRLCLEDCTMTTPPQGDVASEKALYAALYSCIYRHGHIQPRDTMIQVHYSFAYSFVTAQRDI